VCDLPLLPAAKSEPRQGGITTVRLTFDGVPGGPGSNPVTIEQRTCAAPAYVPYSGASSVTAAVQGNDLVLTCTPALENARTYRINIGPDVSTIAGQSVEVRGLFGDVNNDGRVNSFERSTVVGSWTGAFSCASDVDNTGAVNAFDRSAVVGAWTGQQNCAP
jgi:hypothetical protein